MTSPESPIEQDCFLLARIERGGREREAAVSELYHRYGLAFQHYFKRHDVDAAQAEDLAQDVFIKITHGANQFRGNATPSAWLWSIACNTLISHQRGHHLEFVDPPVSDDGEEEWAIPDLACPVDAQMEEEALIDCVRREFARFAAKHADHALALVAFQGWRPADVARYLDRSTGATREYLSQCRKFLQPFLHRCRHLLANA